MFQTIPKILSSLLLIIFLGILFPVFAQKMNYIKGNDTIDITDKYYIKDTNALFFPSKYLLDTINTFGQEKNKEFYERRIRGALHTNSRYTEQLIKLNEPKLFKEYPNESYRFTWFGWLGRSHNPISLRMEQINGNIYLFVKYINSKNSRKHGDLLVSDTFVITEKDWTTLKIKIDSLNFWDIPPIEKTNIVIMDGSTWVFEGKSDGLYHMIHRQNGKNKETGELCLYLLKWSNLKIKKKEFY